MNLSVSRLARRTLVFVQAIVFIGLVTTTAFAGVEGEREAPIVLLWIDTSGSMEYLNEEGLQPNCNAGTPELTRWAQTLEILTGTFNSFTCTSDPRTIPPTREDYGYGIPHIIWNLTGNPDQFDDGLLDILSSEIKFAFGTFDSDLGTGNDALSGYSYGLVTSAGVNLGARREFAAIGGMVMPPVNDLEADYDATAKDIDDSLWSVIPHGGTPISSFLKDGLYMVETDKRMGPWNENTGVGDMFYSCRDKFVLLMTDGKPTMGEDDQGYPTTADAAAELFAAGIKVYVIGFNVEGQEINVLDEIAVAGSGGEFDGAFIADGDTQLSVVMTALLLDILSGPVSRTRTTFTTKTNHALDNLYQFNSGYKGDSSNRLNRRAILEQAIYRCDDSCKTDASDDASSICEIFDIGEALKDRISDRNVLTVVEGRSGLVDFDTGNADLTADALGVPTTGVLSDLVISTLNNGFKVCGLYVAGKASDKAVREKFATQLIGFIRGEEDSCRSKHPLGAIYHSSPVIQSDLEGVDISDPSFTLYQDSVKDRPTVLYTASHDGLFHGFRVDRPVEVAKADYGEELFAYLPKFVHSRLHTLSDRFDFLLDGIPVLREVLLHRKAGDTSEQSLANWRSIVVVPGGFRTSGAFALDVTDPEDPKLLWEITPEGRCAPDSADILQCYDTEDTTACTTGGDCNDFAKLGFIRSKVAIGSVYFRFAATGAAEERAVAIIPGGEARDGVSASGKVVYVVDLETGEKVVEFSNFTQNVVDNNDAAENTDHIDFDMLGEPACYNSFPGTLTTRCIMGDGGGQLWYLRFKDINPDTWRLHYFHDAYNIPEGETPESLDSTNRRPVWESPALSLHPDRGRLVVAYHTNRLSDTRDRSPLKSRLISIVESTVLNADGIAEEVASTTNWVKYFDASMATGPPLIFDRAVYQTAYTRVEGDYCAIGDGRLWGINYVGIDANAIDDIEPAIDADENATTSELTTDVDLGEGRTHGVEILVRPSCSDSGLASSLPPTMEFIIQKTSGEGSDNQKPSSGADSELKRSTLKVTSRFQRVFINAWGNLLE